MALSDDTTTLGTDGTKDDYRFKKDTFESGTPVANSNSSFVGKGYDWSATGWIDLGDTQRLHGLSLISPLQYWTAAHNAPASGLTANFFNGTSIVQATTKNGYISEGKKTDIYVGGFSQALSNSSGVHVSRILDISSGNYVNQSLLVVGSQPKSTDPDHQQKGQQVATAHISRLYTDDVTDTGSFGSLYVSATGTETFNGAEPGDSGSPFYVTYKGELTLAGSWYFSGSGASPFWDNLPENTDPAIRVNAQMATTGYALRYVIYDVSNDSANTANVWTGGAGNGNISAGGNWSKGLIEDNKPVVLDSTTNNGQTTITMDANEKVRGIEFRDNSDGVGFTINGPNVLSVDRTGITNDDHDTQTFNTKIKLLGTQNWTASNGAMTFNGDIDNNGFLLSVIGAKDTTINGVISGSGGLAKDEAGTLHIGSTNTYTGTTFIHDGTVKLEGSGRLGTGILDFIAPNAGAVLDLNGTTSQSFKDLRSEYGGTGRILFNGGTLTLQTGFNGAISYAGSFEDGTTGIGSGKLIVTGLGGTQSLSGDNHLFTGSVEIQSGVLRFLNASSWFTGANIKMNANAGAGGVGGTLELGYGDFTANLGTGAGQVDLTGGGGFSAYGGNRIVNIGGAGATQKWGAGNFVGNNKTLVFSGSQSDSMVDFQNDIDVNGGNRAIYVYNGSNKIDARISGLISNSTGTGGIIKQGAGTLELNQANTFNGATQITNGSILQTVEGALGTGNLVMSGGSTNYDAQLGLGSGNFTRSLGTGAGQVQMGGTAAGFYAYGGNRTVTIGSAGQTLTWGSTYFNPGKLILSNAISDGTLDFQNSIDFGGASRTIQVDNGSAILDARISGGLGNGFLTKTGLGAIEVTGDTSTLTGLAIKGGEFIARSSVGTGNIELTGGGVLGMGYGNISTTIGTGAGQVQFTGSGGFAAYGADRTVNLGADLKWGNTGFIPIDANEATDSSKSLAYSLILGSENADHTIELQNNIDLNGKSRSFDIRNGTAKVDARMSGSLTSDGGGVVKKGQGNLELLGINTYKGTTEIKEGRMTVTNTGSLASTGIIIRSGSAFVYQGASSLQSGMTIEGGLFRYDSSNKFMGTISGMWTGTIAGNGNFSNTSLAIGAGQTIAPGPEDVGTMTVQQVTFTTDGTYLWEINSVTGTAGAATGWDLLKATSWAGFTSTSSNPFLFKIDSLGVLSDWNSGTSYSWKILTTSTGITGFNSSIVSLDYSAFSDENSLSGGLFSVTQSGNDLMLNFTAAAVPEVSTWGLMIISIFGSVVGLRQKRRQ
ncbi:MAG: autotransporter-associated beta strand repeat-containing protein [Verrucomicrobiota bacterium]